MAHGGEGNHLHRDGEGRHDGGEGIDPRVEAVEVAAPPALVATGIGVQLGGRTILRSIDLSIAPGEVFGIFGPSGAGKSTLFRALAGEERPSAGRVLVGGVDVSAMPLWRRARHGLGYLPQGPSVLWDLTVAENMAVYAHLAKSASARDGTESAAILSDLGLEGRLDVAAGALSGGERRRLELARALCGRPRVLLCDEPFAAIDPLGTQRVGERLRRLASEGAAVVIADHNVTVALKLCDRAALLLGGEFATVATPEAFREHERVRRFYAVVESDTDGSGPTRDRVGQ